MFRRLFPWKMFLVGVRLLFSLEEAKHRVDDKPRLLRRVAQAALGHPNKTIRKGIYPVMSREQCQAIIQEEPELEYHHQVYLRMRSSYRDHYRRMMPGVLNMLEFRSNNESHRPVIEALALIKRYIGIPGVYYPPEEDPPVEGVLRPMWHDPVKETGICTERILGLGRTKVARPKRFTSRGSL